MTPTPHRARPCPVCLGNETIPLYANAMAPIAGLDMSYQVSRCASCGFVYASDLPTSSVYETYYRSLSKYDVIASVDAVSIADQLRMSSAVGLCLPHLDKDATIVDIGCGVGTLLHAFAAAGWSDLHGIDPAPGAPAKAESLWGLGGIRTGTLRQAADMLPLHRAGLVCMTGVLEHLPDLREDIAFLVERLAAGAMVLVEVPALERFVREPMEAFGEFSLEHIQFFSSDSLIRLMASLGFACLAHEIVALPGGVTDSLFGLFVRGADTLPVVRGISATSAEAYVHLSEATMGRILDKIATCPVECLVIYGAGSHTARLLPRLARGTGGLGRIVGVVDGNPNLIGQRFGGYDVFAPAELSRWPDATVVVSSFNAQGAITEYLGRHHPNPVLLLYA